MRIFIPLILLLVGCTNTEDKYIRVCAKGHNEMQWIPMYSPSLKMTVLQPHTVYVCDKYKTIENPDYVPNTVNKVK